MDDSPIRLRSRPATEALIVEAGERILLRDGFPGLNVQTLAAEAGCDRKLVYRYFDGADGVVARIAARAHAELVRTLDATPPAGDAVAINAVLLAAVQHLALSGGARPGVGGVALDEAGWARIEGALDALLAAFPD